MNSHALTRKPSPAREDFIDLRPLSDPVYLRKPLYGDIETSTPRGYISKAFSRRRRKADSAPSPDASSGQGDRLLSSYGRESRTCAFGVPCWVDKFASFPGSLGSMGDGEGLLMGFKRSEAPVDSKAGPVEYNYPKPLRQ